MVGIKDLLEGVRELQWRERERALGSLWFEWTDLR